MNIDKLKIPKRYPHTYTDKVDGYLLTYNPVSESGISVLNREAAFIFSKINSRLTAGDIFKLAKKVNPETQYESIEKILENLSISELIFFNKPKQVMQVFSAKTEHIGVWLHITNQCNLRCTYCYVYKTLNQMSKKIAYQSVEKVFASAVKHQIKKITFKFSGGEALLNFPLVLKLVDKARDLGNKFQIKTEFIILTNGILLTEPTVKIIKRRGIQVMVSLDGLKKYHDRTRIFPSGKGSFIYTQKGINNLLKFQVPFIVSVTVSSRNIENVPELTDYFLKNQIRFTFNFYRESPFTKEALTSDDRKMIHYLKQAYKIISDNPSSYSLVNSVLDRVSFKKPHLQCCGMGKNYLVIRHDGKLLSCQTTQSRVIGSIDDPDLIESMVKGNFVRPVGLTVEGKIPCHNCQWKYVCCGGCPLLTFSLKGTYTTNSPYCAVYKALIPEVLKVEARRLIKYDVNN